MRKGKINGTKRATGKAQDKHVDVDVETHIFIFIGIS